MSKLFSIHLEEMSHDILDLGLLNEAEFKEQGSANLNDPIRVQNQEGDDVHIDEDSKNDIQVLDMVQEKLPKTDVIVTINE